VSSKRVSDTSLVEFQNLTVNLGGNTILDHVSASVPLGSCTAVVGPNGAGKTTLLLSLLGEIPYKGEMITSGERGTPSLRIGYVPQRLEIDRGLPITVLEFMVAGWQRIPLWFGVRQRHSERAIELLKAVEADNLAQRRLGALSGGEMQRVLLALALGQTPDLLVLDEPAAGVDFKGEHIFCELLEDLRRKHGFTQLMVSHDLSTVTHHATHVICLNKKVIAQGPPRETLTHENLGAIFGLHMGLVDSRSMADGQGLCSAPCCTEESDNA